MKSFLENDYRRWCEGNGGSFDRSSSRCIAGPNWCTGGSSSSRSHSRRGSGGGLGTIIEAPFKILDTLLGTPSQAEIDRARAQRRQRQQQADNECAQQKYVEAYCDLDRVSDDVRELVRQKTRQTKVDGQARAEEQKRLAEAKKKVVPAWAEAAAAAPAVPPQPPEPGWTDADLLAYRKLDSRLRKLYAQYCGAVLVRGSDVLVIVTEMEKLKREQREMRNRALSQPDLTWDERNRLAADLALFAPNPTPPLPQRSAVENLLPVPGSELRKTIGDLEEQAGKPRGITAVTLKAGALSIVMDKAKDLGEEVGDKILPGAGTTVFAILEGVDIATTQKDKGTPAAGVETAGFVMGKLSAAGKIAETALHATQKMHEAATVYTIQTLCEASGRPCTKEEAQAQYNEAAREHTNVFGLPAAKSLDGE